MQQHISLNELTDIILLNNIKGVGNINYNQDYGNIKTDYFSTESGITYYYNTTTFYNDTVVEDRNNEEISFLCFNTGNSLLLEDVTKKDQFIFDSNTCASARKYKGYNTKKSYSKNKQYLLHYISFEKKLLNEITVNNKNLFGVEENFKTHSFSVDLVRKITQKQKRLLNDLIKLSSPKDKLQEIYLESKLLELIYTTFNLPNINNSDEIYLSAQDIEALNKAKTILIENIINPPSIKDLAHKSAMNDYKLKKGFKQLFGNTVYGFLQEYRLNKAKKLLEKSDINISEVASLVGYKRLSHFSMVFKKYFGINPREIKRKFL
jgi:AraC-like DNA-binding protein